MIVTEVDLYRYELPLTSPLRGGPTSLNCRRGLLVRLTTADGTVGWGDAAPLSGFSSERLAQVCEDARSVAREWTNQRIPGAPQSLDRTLRALPLDDEVPASLRFAVETAVVELLASASGRSLPAALGARRATVEVNALIPDLVGGASDRAAQLQEAGYRAVKVKVGRGSWAVEAERIRALRRVLGDQIALRLDANRAWSLDTALAFAEAIQDVDVAYLEEPVADPAQIGEFAAQTGLPVALDETTREERPEILSQHPAGAVILKPTLLGGLGKTGEWIGIARERDVHPVISAAYESGVGLRMLVALAAAGPDVPTGLSTYDRLSADVLRPRLPLDGPTVDVGDVTTLDRDIHWSHLDSARESSI